MFYLVSFPENYGKEIIELIFEKKNQEKLFVSIDLGFINSNMGLGLE